ncbi:transcriptional initiation protein Tat [Haloferax volcanii]|uniref:Transcriptional initiation protein Tat n=3 Tax=Haloferax volcanii TaxID=2246 RepID=A0A6C0V079_HALVO|nr:MULTISPECIES: hypothetical protein [Haloferax]ELK47553.1 Tat (twin-arginine translocation) pathway signal sequence domain-containing protein [Haloferax sp. BAB-2207]ELZ74498.1 Tat (twin-arginine translocation) pathway signal sequence domain-containing protein [Haloferax lucentense DSM 14919]ELZ93775.1 Tat (twin-arginine translocation) pathway signal sequence domain-containing protein [Haloferax alexandrinus JCM 10717]NLV02494.1 transcriptional initiation protein Tat [Haloferax alexandrinus]
MERRRLLGLVAVGLSSGCLGSLPGATGPRNPPAAPAGNPRDTPEVSPVRIEDIDYEATDDGRLRVFGSVLNDGGAERLTTVEVRVTAGGERTTQSRELTVPAGGTADFEIEFDVEYDAFSDDGDLNVSLV